MNKHLFAVLITLCLVAFGVSAQNVKVSGIVKDADGYGAVGAGVLIKGTTNGTTTDLDGNFSIECKKGTTLVISYLGFKDAEVVVDGSPINITLDVDANQLDEVVVLGYGIAQKKQDLSASVGVMKDPEKITMRNISSSTSMLQGQIPGVTVQQNSGDPTAGHSMVIRGQNSPNGQSILWIVDGVPGAAIPSVNDIASMVVLKDAASAAIYGAQSGAGGVIIVTTKQAKATDGVKVEFDSQVSLSNPVKLIHGLSAKETVEMRHKSCENAGMADFLNGFDDPGFLEYISTDRTDWVDAITRTAVSQRHNVAIGFGTEHAKSRVSAAYKNDEGTLLNTFSRSYNINFKGDYDINKWLKVTENANWSTGRARGTNTSSESGGTYICALFSPSFARAYDEDGRFADHFPAEYSYAASLLGDTYHPLRLLLGDDNWNISQNFQTHTAVQIHDIIPGLKFTSRYSYWLSHNIYKNFHYYRYENTGRQESSSEASSQLNTGASYSTTWKTENTLSYDRTFGKHTISAMLATTADESTGRGLSMTGQGFADESVYLQYMKFAKNTTYAGDWYNGKDTNIALVSRLAYSWNDRYFMTASWRRDYAGRLPYNHNHGDFPAFTGAWKISNEKFFAPLKDTFDLVKLRGSWGRVGNINSIGWNYAANNLTVNENYNERQQAGMQGAPVWGTYIYKGNALNESLTWETCEQWNIGLDFAMFKDRLNFGVDYYNKRTFNLIQSQTAEWPSYIGLDSAPKINSGEVDNRGVEFEFGWNDRINKDFSYYLRGNFSYNHNEIISTGVKNDDGSWVEWSGGGDFRNVPYCYSSRVGGPLGEFYLIKCLGLFQSWEDVYDHVTEDGKLIQPNAQPGDIKFEDYNGDGKIDDSDRQHMGSATPIMTFALSGGFSWKNLSLDYMLQGVGKAQVYYVGQTMVNSDTEGNFSRSEDIKNAWGWYKTTDATVPRLSRNDPNGNFTRASSYFLEDASYLRLKSLTLSYNLTDALRKCSHFDLRGSSLTAYVSGENLLTLTRYSGMDPECGGYDSLKYPVARSVTFGVKISY